MPGDRFAITREKNGSGWNLLINGELARNSEYIPYSLSEQGRRLMELYARDYRGTIPGNAYLILGNRPEGTLDSTRFGLVGASDILGKAIPGETTHF
jgi:type IV secretory pathway protease TraF